jgi:hypothetical protein
VGQRVRRIQLHLDQHGDCLGWSVDGYSSSGDVEWTHTTGSPLEPPSPPFDALAQALEVEYLPQLPFDQAWQRWVELDPDRRF